MIIIRDDLFMCFSMLFQESLNYPQDLYKIRSYKKDSKHSLKNQKNDNNISCLTM